MFDWNRGYWDLRVLYDGYRNRTTSDTQYYDHVVSGWPWYDNYWKTAWGSRHTTIDTNSSAPEPAAWTDRLLFSDGSHPITDFGHDFWSERISVSKPQRVVLPHAWPWPIDAWAYPTSDSSGWGTSLLGSSPESPSDAHVTDSASMSALELMSYGADGITRALSDIPDPQLFTFLGELKNDGLPTIPGSQAVQKISGLQDEVNKMIGKGRSKSDITQYLTRLLGKSAAGEFLNFVFGILPTISDISSFIAVSVNRQAIESQMSAALKQQFRRERQLKLDSTTNIGHSSFYPQFDGSTIWTTDIGSITTTVGKTQRVWFEGVFDHSAWTAGLSASLGGLYQELDRYGGIPSIQGVWNLIPYTWLSDWFVNVGTMLANVNLLGKEGIFMRYGYVMCETSYHENHSWQGPIGGKPAYLTRDRDIVVKQRLRASPLGFGVKFPDLSGFQQAVLFAVGLNKLNF